MKNVKIILAILLALVLSIGTFAGCSAAAQSISTGSAKLATGGTLCLRVNPEIAVSYDENGNVTELVARNEAAKKILANISGYVGKPTQEVVSQLVTAIGNAGYFVEEIEGNTRKITIEIESGSSLPTGTFLNDVIAEVKKIVENHNWTTPIDVEGESLFGLTDYKDTDYGPSNDGVTDYDDTDYGPNNDGITDYDDTDYGPNNDGCTDYGHHHGDGNCTENCTDYGNNGGSSGSNNGGSSGSNNGGSSGSNNGGSSGGKKTTGGKTDYGKTDYGKTDYGKTDYGKTDYNDGKTDYGKTDYGKTDYGRTDYN